MTQILNEGQKEAVERFFGFLVTDETNFILSGGAGTGKTTVVKHIIGNLNDYNAVLEVIGKKGLKDILVTATTNKAAEVIGDTVNIPGKTIHSALGLTVYNDFNTGRTTVKRGKQSSIIYDSLIIIDEISMIDTPLLTEIMKCTVNCKFLFIGDKRQLAPIFEPISPLFNNPSNIIHLTERMRVRDSPALEALNQQLENTVDTGVFKHIDAVPGVIEYLSDAQMEQHLNNKFLVPKPESRILCYSNKRVQQYNSHLRYALNLGNVFTVGEHLVAANAANGINDISKVRPEQHIQVLGIGNVHVHEQLYKEFGYEIEVYEVSTGIGNFWQAVNYEHLTQCIKHAAKEKNWLAYFYMKEGIADFRMPHAATVHKSQGSTYPEVYIDLADIGSCRSADQVARMLYVAISRAQHRVYLYGKLPDKYGG